MHYFRIDKQAEQPIYKQIIYSVLSAIRTSALQPGDKIPSLNEIKEKFDLSRDTVLTAFTEMKNRGVISSSPGKGYYVSTSNINQIEKVFLLFDEFSAFKEDIYNSFKESVGKKAVVDIYFHHFNSKVFRTLISQNMYDYTSYVIMPGSLNAITNDIALLPKEKTFLLDRLIDTKFSVGAVYQDFENDLFNAMKSGIAFLQKYDQLILISPPGKEPTERISGFNKFCEKYNFKGIATDRIELRHLEKGNAFFVPNDRHLVQLIKVAEEKKFELGKNFGVVSFNDTMLKEVAAGGITTISTDFKQMGKTLANLLLNATPNQIKNPSKLIIRKSL